VTALLLGWVLGVAGFAGPRLWGSLRRTGHPPAGSILSFRPDGHSLPRSGAKLNFTGLMRLKGNVSLILWDL
ncbi:MAG: hypothetical protein OXD29_08410, partial [Roseovarius sp.]|nr:hypothetical protein [Roseovarius sp.]